MHLNNITKYILCVLAGVILGGCVFYLGYSRTESNRVAELERSVAERERQLEELNQRNDLLVRRLHEHSERAAELVESMGEQLDRDHDAILSTAELIGALRTQMQDLRDYYNYICSDCGGISDMGSK